MADSLDLDAFIERFRERAKSVRNYLMELGIKPERFTVVSYGKERPFCRDRSETCYQQNRRGHLVVRP